MAPDDDPVTGAPDRATNCATDGGGEPGGSVVAIRPHAYVEPEPVIRRIGDRELFLGNVHAADGARHDRTFRYVLSATSDPQPLTTHHRPLVDGPEHEWDAFAAAADTARELYRRDGSLLVHCTAGISRSATILTIALAAEEGHSFRDALAEVQAARPPAQPHPALHETAVTYLAARA